MKSLGIFYLVLILPRISFELETFVEVKIELVCKKDEIGVICEIHGTKEREDGLILNIEKVTWEKEKIESKKISLFFCRNC